MEITINDKSYKLEFTFNSFKYMKDFDIGEMQNLESQPFKIIDFCEQLLYGAINNDPKIYVSMEEIDSYLEEYINDGSLGELIEQLMDLLQESNFFKALQKNTKKSKAKTK